MIHRGIMGCVPGLNVVYCFFFWIKRVQQGYLNELLICYEHWRESKKDDWLEGVWIDSIRE